MRTVAVWTAFVFAYSSRISLVAGLRYIDPISSVASGNVGDVAEKRVNLIEPTCEELRAMWRYTKRQSRAAKTTTGYPVYTDPFSYNIWQSYPDRPKPALSYKARFTARARSRAAGGAPIYGRMVHKAPAGSRLRNGMRHRSRAFEDVACLYGTINRSPPSSSRRRVTSFRIGGGGSPSPAQVPQAGSFQHLKELIRAERARELQEQHMAEEVAAKTGSFIESANGDRQTNMQQSREQLMNPLPPLQISTNGNYEFSQGRYMSNMPNIGQAWSRSGPQSREYMLH